MISVIVTTAPGREDNLQYCLRSLQQQSLAPTEVIVTDDGTGSEAIVQQWADRLPLTYLSRPNDRTVARSRNLAAARATQPFLVILDGDILLNPEGLAAYQTHFESRPDALWSGFFGNNFHHESPSHWFEERLVNYVDKRFEACFANQFYPFAHVLETPALCYWGGNMGIPKARYEELKGFNETYTGWGGEDVEFALRAIQAGCELHFSVDVWAEHQIHPRNDAFFLQKPAAIQRKQEMYAAPHPEFDYEVEIACASASATHLQRLLTKHYTQQDPEVSAALKQKLHHEQANLVARVRPENQRLELGCVLGSP